MSVLFSDDVDNSKVVEDIHVLSKTTSIIENISVGSDISILDEGHTSYEGTSEIVDAIVESDTPLIVDAHVHDNSDIVPELVESNVSSQLSRYSFATHVIEGEIDHETSNSSVITSMGHLNPLVLIMILWSFLSNQLQ